MAEHSYTLFCYDFLSDPIVIVLGLFHSCSVMGRQKNEGRMWRGEGDDTRDLLDNYKRAMI